MNSTNTTNNDVINYHGIAWVISLGSVFVIVIIILSIIWCKSSQDTENYIKWIRTKKRGDAIQQL